MFFHYLPAKRFVLALILSLQSVPSSAQLYPQLPQLLSTVAPLATTFAPTIGPIALTYSSVREPTKEENRKRFFKDNFVELKRQIAIGKGEILTTFASNMVDEKHIDNFIGVLKYTYPKLLTKDVDEAWRHMTLIAYNSKYKKLKLWLPQINSTCIDDYYYVTSVPSELFNIVTRLASKNNNSPSMTEKGCDLWEIEGFVLVEAVAAEYQANPNHNSLDAYIYEHLKDYAEHLPSDKIKTLLPYDIRPYQRPKLLLLIPSKEKACLRHDSSVKRSASSLLGNLIKRMGVADTSSSSCTRWLINIEDLIFILEKYYVDPNDNQVDAFIYEQIQRYAQKTQHTELTELLKYEIND